MVKRLFHTGFALGRAPGLETWSFKVQNTNFIGLSYGQICPKDTFLKSLYENNDRLFWVILSGFLLINLFTCQRYLCHGLGPKSRWGSASYRVDPLHRGQDVLKMNGFTHASLWCGNRVGRLHRDSH